MDIKLKNNERLILLKHVNKMVRSAEQKITNIKTLEGLYILQAKLKITKQTTEAK